MPALLLVAAGGAVGGLLRAGVGRLLPHEPGSWSWSVLLVNAVGAFALAALLGVLARRPDERTRLLVGTGLLGGFTTFSGLAVDAVLLIEAGRPLAAAAYVGAGVGTLLAGAAAGLLVGRTVRR